jgi:hypothetical protein
MHGYTHTHTTDPTTPLKTMSVDNFEIHEVIGVDTRIACYLNSIGHYTAIQ